MSTFSFYTPTSSEEEQATKAETPAQKEEAAPDELDESTHVGTIEDEVSHSIEANAGASTEGTEEREEEVVEVPSEVIDRLTNELKVLQDSQAAAHNENSQAKMNLTELLSRINTLTDCLNEKDTALANAEKSLSSTTKDYEEMRTKQSSAWEKEKDLASRLRESEASLQDVMSRSRKIELEREQKDKALATSQDETYQAKMNLNEMLNRVNKLMNRLDEKDTALATATNSLSSVKKEYEEMQTKKLSSWKEVKDDLVSRLHESEFSLQDMMIRSRKVEMDRDQKDKALAIAHDDAYQAKMNQTELLSRVNMLVNRLDEKDAALATAKSSLSSVTEEYEEMQVNQSFAWEKEKEDLASHIRESEASLQEMMSWSLGAEMEHELKDKELATAHDEIFQAKMNQTEMLSHVNTLTKCIEEKDAALTTAKSSLSSVTEEYKEMQTKMLSDWKEEKDDLGSRLRESEASLQDTTNRGRKVELDREQKGQALATACNENAQAKMNQTEMLSRINRLMDCLDKKNAELSTAKKALSSATKEYEEMQTKQSSSWEKEKEHLVSRLRDSESSLQDTTSRSHKIEIETEHKNKALAAARSEISQANMNQTELLSRVNMVVKRLNEKDAALATAESSLSSVTKEYEEIQTKHCACEKEKEDLASCLHESDSCLQDMTSQCRKVEMEREQKDKSLAAAHNKMSHDKMNQTKLLCRVNLLMDSLNEKDEALATAESTLSSATKEYEEMQNSQSSAWDEEKELLVSRLRESESSLQDMTNQSREFEMEREQKSNALATAHNEISQAKMNQTELLSRVNMLMDSLNEKDEALVAADSSLLSATKAYGEMQTHQSSAWEEEKEHLTSRLRESETSLQDMTNQSRKVEMEREQKGNALATAHNELSQAKMNQTELLSRVNMLMDRLNEKDAALAAADSFLSSATKEYEELQTKQSSAWEEEKEHLVSRLLESESNLQDISSQSRKVGMESEQKDKAVAAAHIEIYEAKINQTELLSRVNMLVDRLNEKDAALATAESSLSSATKEYEELQTKQLLAREEEKDNLVSRLLESESILQDTTSQSRKVEMEREQKDKALAAAQNEISQAKMNQTELISRVNTLTDRLNEKNAALATAERSLSSTTKEYDEMQTKQLSAWKEEKKDLVSHLRESEVKLQVMMSMSRNSHVEMERESPFHRPPLPRKPDDASELTRLQLSFLKDKKELLDRQPGREMMLQDALHAVDKENSHASPLHKEKSSLQSLASPLNKEKSSLQSLVAQKLASLAMKQSQRVQMPLSPRNHRERSPSPFKVNTHPTDVPLPRRRIALDSPMRQIYSPVDPE